MGCGASAGGSPTDDDDGEDPKLAAYLKMRGFSGKTEDIKVRADPCPRTVDAHYDCLVSSFLLSGCRMQSLLACHQQRLVDVESWLAALQEHAEKSETDLVLWLSRAMKRRKMKMASRPKRSKWPLIVEAKEAVVEARARAQHPQVAAKIAAGAIAARLVQAGTTARAVAAGMPVVAAKVGTPGAKAAAKVEEAVVRWHVKR